MKREEEEEDEKRRGLINEHFLKKIFKYWINWIMNFS